MDHFPVLLIVCKFLFRVRHRLKICILMLGMTHMQSLQRSWREWAALHTLQQESTSKYLRRIPLRPCSTKLPYKAYSTEHNTVQSKPSAKHTRSYVAMSHPLIHVACRTRCCCGFRYTRWGFNQLMDAGVDLIQPDVMWMGGPTEFARIVALVRDLTLCHSRIVQSCAPRCTLAVLCACCTVCLLYCVLAVLCA